MFYKSGLIGAHSKKLLRKKLVDYVDGIGVIDEKRSAPFFKTFSVVGRLSCDFDELYAHRLVISNYGHSLDHVGVTGCSNGLSAGDYNEITLFNEIESLCTVDRVLEELFSARLSDREYGIYAPGKCELMECLHLGSSGNNRLARTEL